MYVKYLFEFKLFPYLYKTKYDIYQMNEQLNSGSQHNGHYLEIFDQWISEKKAYSNY